MSRTHRPCALLLGASLAFAALATPGIAHADDAATATTPTAVVAALKAAQKPTATAEAAGWTAHASYTEGDQTYASDLTYAVSEGRVLFAETGTKVRAIAVDHQGIYESVPSYAESEGRRRLHRALAMIGHPDQAWIFEPDSSVDLTDPSGFGAADPNLILSALVGSRAKIVGTPTESAAADGSTTYGFTVKMTDPGDGTDTVIGYVTVAIDAGDQLTGFTDDFGYEQDAETFSYGPQDIALPASDTVVRESLVQEGLHLLNLTSDVRRVVDFTQHGVPTTAQRHLARVRAIRSSAAFEVRQTNREYGASVFVSRKIANGARITGTNPFTGEKVAFTVTAIGKRIAVRRIS